ncbi:MAG: GDSL-type esterase/lipase family protein [Elusimicrobiota bacterium]|jgi:lysophospholipase L1-like esterase
MPSRRALLLASLSVAALLLAGGEFAARRADIPVPDRADLFELWTLGDDPVFVPDGGDRLRTHPELSAIDNAPVSFAAARPAGTRRVVCLGGSTTAGWPFHPRGSYPARLGAYLRDLRPDARVEVVNAGFHNFDSRREVSVARELARLRPTAALVYSGFNDYQTYLARSGAGRLLSLARAPHRFLLRRSRLYGWLRWKAGLSGSRTVASAFVLPLNRAQEERLLAEHRRNLEETARVLSAAGAQVVLVPLAWEPGFDPAFAPQELFARMNEGVRAVAGRTGARVLETGGVLRRADFVDTEHLSLEGYAKLARAAARELCRGALADAPCREGRLRSEAAYRKELGIADPMWLAHARLRLGLVYSGRGLLAAAGRELEEAERLSPVPGFILDRVLFQRDPALLELLARADERLGFADRARAAREACGLLRRSGR